MVSIVLPVYNVEKYLANCIDSLLAQTYTDYEIIIVNDGSTDKSELICKEYQKKSNKIKLYSKKNEGLGYARNTGLLHVCGEYVLFLDSDDMFKPTLIEDLKKNISNPKVDTCVGGFERMSEEGDDLGPYGKAAEEAFFDDDVKNVMLPRLFGSLPDKHDGIVISACNTLYSMDIIRSNGLEFVSEREFTSEDLFFNLDYFQYSKGVFFTGKRNYLYRINPKSLSHLYRDNRFEMKQKIYIEGCKRLKSVGIFEKAEIRFMKYYLIGIKLCIRQETPRISGKSFTNCRNRIVEICRNEILSEILQVYPIKSLEFKQRLFVLLLKYKFASILELFSIIGVME